MELAFLEAKNPTPGRKRLQDVWEFWVVDEFSVHELNRKHMTGHMLDTCWKRLLR